MRTAFLQTLVQIAERDESVCLLVGDLGFGVVTPFAERFPDRFVNVGVAEQNMTGVAAGMALCGKVVFTYSIGNFPTLRCVEQIRNDVCYHNANVKIVSVGGGVAYGTVGSTHHATEDIAIMRTLPNMTVVAPGDPIEAGLATAALVAQPGPAYLRLGRVGEPPVHGPVVDFGIGKAITILNGSDLTLIATGSLLHNAVQAAERLSAWGVQTRVLSMHTIKPLDVDAVLAAAQETAAIVTLEEHSVVGGLGSAVMEALVNAGVFNIPMKQIGLPPRFTSEVGCQEYLWELYSLSVEQILASIEQFIAHIPK